MRIIFRFEEGKEIKLCKKEVNNLIKHIKKAEIDEKEIISYEKEYETGATLIIKKYIMCGDIITYRICNNCYSGAVYSALIMMKKNQDYYLSDLAYEGKIRGFMRHETDARINFLLDILCCLTDKKYKKELWQSLYMIAISSNYIKELPDYEHNYDNEVRVYFAEGKINIDESRKKALQKAQLRMEAVDASNEGKDNWGDWLTDSVLYTMVNKILGE